MTEAPALRPEDTTSIWAAAEDARSIPACPECNSNRLYRDGMRYLSDGQTVQRYLCRDCGYRFSENSKSRQRQKGKCRVGALGFEPSAKNSAGQEVIVLAEAVENGQRAAGATVDNVDVKGVLVQLLWHLMKNGYAESTANKYVKALKTLMNFGADLYDPESVKQTIACQKWREGTKHCFVNVYDAFARFMKIKWEKPRYGGQPRLPFLPLEREIDLLIYGAPRKVSIALQIIKETAARIGEVARLKWVDVDFERCLITINAPEKNGRSRIFRVSRELIQRLSLLPRKTQYIFKATEKPGFIDVISSLNSNFHIARKRLAREYQNPRLLQIGFHTIRHWKATMEYHKTKDILHVKNMLGHVGVNNTLIYINLEQALFGTEDNTEFHVKTTKSLEEACQLIRDGFEYVMDMDGYKLFRKRK